MKSYALPKDFAVHYYGPGRIFGFAMTVLDCAKCKHRVWLEAHHDHRGRPKLWKPRPGRKPLRLRWSGNCPKCAHPAWRYVRTEVSVSAPMEAFYRGSPRHVRAEGRVAHECGRGCRVPLGRGLGEGTRADGRGYTEKPQRGAGARKV